MRIAGVALIVAFLAGCAQPRVQPVFVDFNRVPLPSPKAPLVVPRPPDTKMSVGSVITSTPGQTIRGVNTDARRAAILGYIEDNRKIAEKELAERLRLAYLSDVERRQQELMTELDERRRELFTGAFSAIRPVFEEYAERRAGPLLDLTLFAGFPDPDPQSKRPLPEADKFALRRAQTMVNARKSLEQTEAWYQGQVSALLKKAGAQFEVEELYLFNEFDRMRKEAEARAMQEASAQVNRDLAEINPSLAQTSPLVLAPTQEKKVTIQSEASATGITPPEDRSVTIREQAREQAELDAKVWAATSGYKLSSSRSDPDKTEEFLAWRSKRHDGP